MFITFINLLLFYQLKERQLKRKEEIEKKRQDDLAEERRIQKQQELERKRLDDELKRQREKEVNQGVNCKFIKNNINQYEFIFIFIKL